MTVGIVGLGYVGWPLAGAFAEAGTSVGGVDHDDVAARAPLTADLRGVTRGVESGRAVRL